MSYQGVLAVPGAGAVRDGTYTLTFRLYESPVGGAVLWSETLSADVVNGVFSVVLGKSQPLNLSFDRTYLAGHFGERRLGAGAAHRADGHALQLAGAHRHGRRHYRKQDRQRTRGAQPE